MWIVCITSVRHVLTVNGYGGRQTKENEKSWCFKGWETLDNNNMYEIKWDSKGAKPKGRLYFVGTGEEKKLIHSIRAEYIHLSAHRSTWPVHPHEATKDNQRIFIKG